MSDEEIAHLKLRAKNEWNVLSEYASWDLDCPTKHQDRLFAHVVEAYVLGKATRVTNHCDAATSVKDGHLTKMGVGAGDGELFVYGDYDSIKAAQAIVLERDALRVQLGRGGSFVINDKVKLAIEYAKNGDPWKDVLDSKDVAELLISLDAISGLSK